MANLINLALTYFFRVNLWMFQYDTPELAFLMKTEPEAFDRGSPKFNQRDSKQLKPTQTKCTHLTQLLADVITLLLILELRLAHCFDETDAFSNERFFLLHNSLLFS